MQIEKGYEHFEKRKTYSFFSEKFIHFVKGTCPEIKNLDTILPISSTNCK